MIPSALPAVCAVTGATTRPPAGGRADPSPHFEPRRGPLPRGCPQPHEHGPDLVGARRLAVLVCRAGTARHRPFAMVRLLHEAGHNTLFRPPAQPLRPARWPAYFAAIPFRLLEAGPRRPSPLDRLAGPRPDHGHPRAAVHFPAGAVVVNVCWGPGCRSSPRCTGVNNYWNLPRLLAVLPRTPHRRRLPAMPLLAALRPHGVGWSAPSCCSAWSASGRSSCWSCRTR